MLTPWNSFFFNQRSTRKPSFININKELEDITRAPFFLHDWFHVAEERGPSFRFIDQETHFQLQADVPGMSRDGLQLNADNRNLSLSGERKSEVPEGYEAQTRERSSLKFKRDFKFPCSVDVANIEATLKDGVLDVRIPKSPEATPRHIDIQVN